MVISANHSGDVDNMLDECPISPLTIRPSINNNESGISRPRTRRILLVDDHRILRDALRALLELDGGIAVVAEAGDGMTALGLAAQTRPDIVVMDINMQGLNGIEVTKQLLSRYPEVKVIALSAHSDKRFVLGMLEAGASGYIIKAAAGDELLRAIEAALNGQTYLCSEVAAAVVDALCQQRKENTAALGRREKEVLQLLAGGLRTPEIARRLYISASTVEVHRRNIMRKLELHSIVELTKYAIREGLVEV